MKVGVLFGGKSTEHDVSIVSGTSILNEINKDKYDVYAIYISKEGLFYEYKPKEYKKLLINEEIDNIYPIDNIINYLKEMDVILPVLHGLYGEDGTIQGLLELIGIPYVGCHVLASSLCMDKVYTKKLLKSINIPVTKDMYLQKDGNKYIYIDEDFNYNYLSSEELIELVSKIIKFPLFIKPSNSGSSVGVHKTDKSNFIEYLDDAFKYDDKVLLEEEIIGREVECAILGNKELIVSHLGEVLKSDYYDYDSKYISSVKTSIPANISDDLSDEIRSMARKAYYACDCKGLSRIDFFIENNTSKIYLNEINTLPGFTSISMYPKLMEEIGISYSELIDKLINFAIDRR